MFPSSGVPSLLGARGGISSQCYGGHGERETPGLIPNPEAKPFSADGTARGTGWESRTPPDIFSRNGVTATAVAPFRASTPSTPPCFIGLEHAPGACFIGIKHALGAGFMAMEPGRVVSGGGRGVPWSRRRCRRATR